MSLEIFTFTLVTLVFVPPLLCPQSEQKMANIAMGESQVTFEHGMDMVQDSKGQ
jgi:hypothetical protein